MAENLPYVKVSLESHKSISPPGDVSKNSYMNKYQRYKHLLTLDGQSKIAADDILIFLKYFSEKIRLGAFHVNHLPSR